MDKIIIINGSPRTTKSNSRHYSEMFRDFYKGEIEYLNLVKINFHDICRSLGNYDDILFVFPLYADGIPTTLLKFLKTLEEDPPSHKPVVNVLINCGFIEPEQNNVCIDMIKLFCRQNGYTFGSVLSIGGGEAILDTPFKVLVSGKIKKLAKAINKKKFEHLEVTMPLTKKLYIKASTNYWIEYGARNGISKAEMETMKIEED